MNLLLETKSILRKFEIAKQASLHSEYRYKLGAAIFDKSNLVSIGFNSLKTHTRFNDIHNPFHSQDKAFVLHAEMSAILKSKRSLVGCDMFVYREHKNGSKALSRPCMYCYEACKEVGIKYVYYVSEFGYHRERLN